MSRVCVSGQTGAAIHVFADDHCPPHVHARHRGEGWVARVGFSFVTNEVRLISVTPLRNIPLPRVISHLLQDIADALPACRGMWWAMRGTVCLANRWALRQQPIEILSERQPGAVQVVDASYDPTSRRLSILWRDGAAATLAAGSGVEL